MHLRKTRNANSARFLSLILSFVSLDVICDNYLVGSLDKESFLHEFLLFAMLGCAQIIFSPLQAGLSDFFGRKKGLLISITFSLISLIIAYLHGESFLSFAVVLLLIPILKGVFGNTIPIAWAAVGDLGNMEGKNLRFSFALATASYAIGFLTLVFLKNFMSDNNATLMIITLFAVSITICYKFFFDIKDAGSKENKNAKLTSHIQREVQLVIRDIKNRSNQLIFLSFILWEISIYIMLVYYADFNKLESAIIEVLMMAGYLVGVLSMRFMNRISDEKMIRIGYAISVVSLIPYFAYVYFIGNSDILLGSCYFFHAIGNALLSATTFSILSTNRKVHERGKIYGLAESADTLAFFISGIIIIYIKNLKIDTFLLITISFLTALISWIPYRNFEKSQNKVQ